MVVERVIDLPWVIVVDAFIDPILVEGWMHPTARLVPDGSAIPPQGVPIVSETDELGQVQVELYERARGTRGASTRVVITVQSSLEPHRSTLLRASWLTRIDQLEGLLRGHPVDWEHWDEQYGADYAGYLAQGAS